MVNCDTFIGEIKELEHGEVVLKSAYKKVLVHLDLKRVKSLLSKVECIVSLSDGRRLTGTIDIQATLDTTAFEIITNHPQEVSFWNQLTGSVNYEFSFAGSNSRTVNSSLGADAGFSTEKNAIRLATSSQFDSQDHSNNTNRITFDSEYT